MVSFVENASLSRAEMVKKLFDPRRDINAECGYSDPITPDEYQKSFDREGLGRRVVEFWPEEAWIVDPVVFETRDPSKTTFETAWEELEEALNVYFWLHKIDVLSGIGRFGCLLLGFSDINSDEGFSKPVALAEKGEQAENEVELLYLRAFSENVAVVKEREAEKSSPRFGQPTMYTLTFEEPDATVDSRKTGKQTSEELEVHWSRLIHVADNLETSLIFGTPRQQVVWNRIMDSRKVLSGSAEMFWKGAFPGYSLESQPGAVEPDAAGTTKLKKQVDDFFNGLQRIMATTGFTVKSLAPQISDPKSHMQAIMDNVAFTLGVPKRRFIGSEQAQLASVQDSRTFNARVAKRQNKYVSPMIVKQFIDRLIMAGALPLPAGGYKTEWPDLNTVTDQDKAEVATKRTEALAKYVMGNVDQVIPPKEYLTIIHGLDAEQVETITQAAEEHQEEGLLMDRLPPAPGNVAPVDSQPVPDETGEPQLEGDG
jgi:hypothetical protein